MSKSTLLSVLMFGSMTLFGHNEPIVGPGPNSKLLNVKLFLEGAFDIGTGTMNTALNTGSLVPLAQPFNIAPWNYPGTESVATIPAGVVDWVLVELRDAATPTDAILAVNLATWPKAFFLKSDGLIVALDGASLPNIDDPTVINSLFVVIRHRNHLAVLSSAGAILSGDVYSYDFTTGLAQAYGGDVGYKMAGSKAVMVAGDIDQDENIFVSDYNSWAAGFGAINGYNNSDLDMDRNVFVSDYNKWATNFGSTAQVGSGDCAFTDLRDGHTYKCLVIGGQTWMAENLAFLPAVYGSAAGSYTNPYYYVYGYEGSIIGTAKATANYGIYGVLYNWPAAMNGASGSTSVPSGVQGVCPLGWHLPSDAEWAILTEYLTTNGYGFGGSGNDIAKSLAVTSGWLSNVTVGTPGNDQASNNGSGFSALPGGNRNFSGGFNSLGDAAYHWSATANATASAWTWNLFSEADNMRQNSNARVYGFSVRCLKNN